MYAFAGQGIAKKGKHCVPYFSSRDDALTWWEQRLHDQARADSSAPLAALQRLKPLVQDANGVIVEAGGVRLQVQASNTRKATGYVGVTEKVETAGGKRTSVFVAKSVGEYLGAFGTAAEAARAYAQYMLSQARDAVKLAAPPLPPVAAAAAPPALPAPKRKTPAAAEKAPAKAKGCADLGLDPPTGRRATLALLPSRRGPRVLPQHQGSGPGRGGGGGAGRRHRARCRGHVHSRRARRADAVPCAGGRRAARPTAQRCARPGGGVGGREAEA